MDEMSGSVVTDERINKIEDDISANAQSIIDIKNQIGDINTLLDTINGEVI